MYFFGGGSEGSLQISISLLPGIILGIINFIIFNQDNNIVDILKNLFNFGICFNFLSLGYQKIYLQKDYLFNKDLYNVKPISHYFILSLLFGIFYIFIKWLIYSNLEVEKAKYNHKILRVILIILSVIFVIVGSIFKYFSDWFIGYFGEITPEQFLFNLKSPLKGTESTIIFDIIKGPVFCIIFTTVLFGIIILFSCNIFMNIKYKRVCIINQKLYQVVVIIITFIFMLQNVIYGFQKLHLKEIIKSYTSDSTYLEDNYKDPRKVKLLFPKQKRNLIHIYLESMETSFLSKDLGGYQDENLIPELTELLNEGDSFSHNDVYGGPKQTYGSSWSIASMVNMMAGIPLKIAEYGTNGSFLPGIITLGDILEAEDYEQTIMFGSDIDFGGLSTYFKDHGNYNQFDLKHAKAIGLIPEDYYEWWGFEDEKLYEYAKEEIIRLANTGKPFNFTMETADTHFPDGFLSPNAPTLYDKQYANVIAFASKQAYDFINWLKEQHFYENTTVVITGDHLSMDEAFFADWDPNYERNVYNVILNSGTTTENTDRFKNRQYSLLDFYPTILASIGVEIKGDRLGLGTNLYSDKPTLIERDGLYKFNDELSLNSKFYLDEFIDDNNDSVYKSK